MDPLDRHFPLRRQASGVFENFAACEDSARLRLEKQLRHAARLQPVGIGVHDRGYIGRIALDGDFPGQRQSRSSALAGLGEGPPVLRHLLVGEHARSCTTLLSRRPSANAITWLATLSMIAR